MSNPFTARKSWAAAVVAFFLGPFVGMLYLGRGALALFYFALGLAVFAGGITLLLFGLAGISAFTFMSYGGWTVSLIGAVHAYFLARKWDAAGARPWYSHWYAIAGISLLLPATIALMVRTFLYQPFSIQSGSGIPSLEIGDNVFVSKFAYTIGAPRRGDLVVFRVPALGGAAYIKRIVGLPGEHIQMRGGILFVNGVPAKQRRVSDWVETDAFGALQHVPQYEESLPGGHTDLVLDRGESDFDNTAIFTVPADSYFVLGDNRDNSDDSRGREGYVPRDQLVGPVVVKHFSGGHFIWQEIE